MARKYKRATAPLDETATARLWQEVSSCVSVESTTSDTAELADLIDSFYNEEEIDERKGKYGMGSEKGGYLTRRSLDAVLAESEADMVAHRIRVAAERGVSAVSPAGDGCKRRVMGWLRDKGFDAGVYCYYTSWFRDKIMFCMDEIDAFRLDSRQEIQHLFDNNLFRAVQVVMGESWADPGRHPRVHRRDRSRRHALHLGDRLGRRIRDCPTDPGLHCAAPGVAVRVRGKAGRAGEHR